MIKLFFQDGYSFFDTEVSVTESEVHTEQGDQPAADETVEITPTNEDVEIVITGAADTKNIKREDSGNQDNLSITSTSTTPGLLLTAANKALKSRWQREMGKDVRIVVSQ